MRRITIVAALVAALAVPVAAACEPDPPRAGSTMAEAWARGVDLDVVIAERRAFALCVRRARGWCEAHQPGRCTARAVTHCKLR